VGIKDTLVAAAGRAAGEIMTGLDGLFTSDDERLSAQAKITQIMNDMSRAQLDHVAAQEKERTARLQADMQSDSWLSKNVRPMSLAYLLGLFTLLAMADSFEALNFNVAPMYIDLLQMLLVSVFGFYFVSRGVEKVAQAVKDARQTNIKIK
jgi:hypothetical protein